MPEENKTNKKTAQTKKAESKPKTTAKTAKSADKKTETAEEISPAAKTKPTPRSTADDKTTRKIIFSLCYIFGILFFLPLILYKNDAEANRHANDGLVLLILSVIGNAVFGLLARVAGVFGLIAGIYSLILFVFGIIGIVYVVTESDRSLPLIGALKIIK